MRRTFKRADGTEETLEGTAEELAEYERRLREQSKPAPKPGVIKGKGLEELIREIQAVPERVAERVRGPWPNWDPGPIWVVSCPVCGRVGCDGNHWDQPLNPWPHFTITMTTTADRVLLQEQPVAAPGYVLGQWQGSSDS